MIKVEQDKEISMSQNKEEDFDNVKKFGGKYTLTQQNKEEDENENINNIIEKFSKINLKVEQDKEEEDFDNDKNFEKFYG